MKMLTEEVLKERGLHRVAKVTSESGVIADYNALPAEREAEIERFHRLLASAHGVAHVCEVRAEKAEAEIERLRSQLAAMERGYKSFRDTAELEFTRLRHELADAHGIAQACEIRAEKAEAGTKRLRAAVRYAAQSIDAGVPLIEVRDKMVEVLDE